MPLWGGFLPRGTPLWRTGQGRIPVVAQLARRFPRSREHAAPRWFHWCCVPRRAGRRAGPHACASTCGRTTPETMWLPGDCERVLDLLTDPCVIAADDHSDPAGSFHGKPCRLPLPPEAAEVRASEAEAQDHRRVATFLPVVPAAVAVPLAEERHPWQCRP